eukprot:3937564-Rhodomonas_salina.4
MHAAWLSPLPSQAQTCTHGAQQTVDAGLLALSPDGVVAVLGVGALVEVERHPRQRVSLTETNTKSERERYAEGKEQGGRKDRRGGEGWEEGNARESLGKTDLGEADQMRHLLDLLQRVVCTSEGGEGGGREEERREGGERHRGRGKETSCS